MRESRDGIQRVRKIVQDLKSAFKRRGMLLSAGHMLSAGTIRRIRKYAMAEGLNLALHIRMPG